MSVFPEGPSLASLGTRPEYGELTGTISPSPIPWKRKKLLVEGRPVSLIPGGTSNIPASIIPEGHHHIFIRRLAEGILGGQRVNHNRQEPFLICRCLVADENNGLARCSGIRIALDIEPDVGDPVIGDDRFIECCTGTTDDIPDILVHAE